MNLRTLIIGKGRFVWLRKNKAFQSTERLQEKEHCITEPELWRRRESEVSLYATTCEELYEKQLEGRRQVEEIIFRRKHPTVAEYCEKWLLMQSAKVSTATIKGYRQNMKNYVINSLGDMYMEEVTADDIRLALVPLSQNRKDCMIR